MDCIGRRLRVGWMICSGIVVFVLGVHRLEKEELMGWKMIGMLGGREVMLL